MPGRTLVVSVEEATVGSSTALNEIERQLEDYLLDEVDGLSYFKSRLIAEDLDISSKSVGHNMRRLAEDSTVLDIESWGYSSGTTWMVQLVE
jgi:hypothetical protein